MIRSTPQSDSPGTSEYGWLVDRAGMIGHRGGPPAGAYVRDAGRMPYRSPSCRFCDATNVPSRASRSRSRFPSGRAVAPAADLANTGTDQSSAGVPWLLGDWDGARTRLKTAGVNF